MSEAIRAAIANGELTPGEIYSAITLGDRLGVSPTPVREAMLDLVRAGLVETVRNRGFRITPLEEADLLDLADVRERLEVPVLQAVADSADPGLIAALDQLADACEAAVGGAAFQKADRRFHERLLEFSGNAKLVSVATDLLDQAYLMAPKPPGSSDLLAELAQDHHDIVDALRVGDADRAAATMRAHLLRDLSLAPALDGGLALASAARAA